MLRKFVQMIFVPKRARTKMAARRQPPGRPSVKPPVKQRDVPPPLSQGTYDTAASRDQLLNDTMTLYRQQRQDVYDTLDEATKRQIEEDAEKAFGKVLRPKD